MIPKHILITFSFSSAIVMNILKPKKQRSMDITFNEQFYVLFYMYEDTVSKRSYYDWAQIIFPG